MSDSPQPSPQTGTLIDGHVHLHPGVDLQAVLSTCATNMGLDDGGTGAMLLSEMAGCDRFGELSETTGPWTATPCDEPMSWRARHDSGATLIVVSGRQAVAAEGLEVLIQGTRATFDDGQPLRDLLGAAKDSGAIATLPWGVGKWSGTRGAIIAALIDDIAEPVDLYLADSGVRPGLWPYPKLLTRAAQAGWKILAGTDPLPLPGEERRPGGYGFIAPAPLDPATPFASLRTALRQSATSPAPFGRLESPARFLRNQVAMQLRKRLG